MRCLVKREDRRSLLFILSVWLNYSSQMNKINQINQSYQSRLAILPILVMSYAGPTDLTPRRGLVYDAVLV